MPEGVDFILRDTFEKEGLQPVNLLVTPGQHRRAFRGKGDPQHSPMVGILFSSDKLIALELTYELTH